LKERELIGIGRVRRSIGVTGNLRIEPLTHTPARFKGLNTVYVGRDEMAAIAFTVEQADIGRAGIRLKLKGIDSKTASDGFRGQFVFVEESETARPPKGSHFVHDVIGSTVIVAGSTVGTVTEVYLRTGGLAQDIWIVTSVDGQKRYWLPAVPRWIKEVDPERKRIVVNEEIDLIEDIP
jgi:16S rRNA processing protein RimM